MGQLRCNKCDFIFEEKGNEHGDTEQCFTVCPRCGSQSFEKIILLTDSLKIHENVRGKAKLPGKRKPMNEFQAGEEWSVSMQEYVGKRRIIDRENDYYHEKVVNLDTGEIIHECEEPLNQHYNHGSAKKRNKHE